MKKMRLVPDLFFFFFKESVILGKSKWSGARFHYISTALKSAYNKNKLYTNFKTIDPEIYLILFS